MRYKIYLSLILCLCLMTFVSANTILEIKTLPDYELFITGLHPTSTSFQVTHAPLKTFTGKYGEIRLDYPIEESTFDIALRLKNGSKTILYKVYDGDFLKDTTINLTLAQEGMDLDKLISDLKEADRKIAENITEEENLNETIIINETVIVNESLEEIESNESETGVFKGIFMNGYAVIQENKPVLSIVSYVLGAIVLVAPVYMLLRRRKKKKGSSMIPDEAEDKKLKKAKEALKKAQEKVDFLKKDKIAEAKEKLMEDEKELMRLRALKKKQDED